MSDHMTEWVFNTLDIASSYVAAGKNALPAIRKLILVIEGDISPQIREEILSAYAEWEIDKDIWKYQERAIKAILMHLKSMGHRVQTNPDVLRLCDRLKEDIDAWHKEWLSAGPSDNDAGNNPATGE